jgi:hypothetical protein
MNPSNGRRRPQDDGGEEDREGVGGAEASRSTSRKSQRSSNRDSPSAVANNRNGFVSAISILRSVLHHKLGLPLTLHLHGGDDNTLYDTLVGWFPELLLDPPPPDAPPPPTPTPPRPQPLPVVQQLAWPLNEEFDGIMEHACREWLNDANREREEPKERPLTGLYADALRVALEAQFGHNLTVEEHDAEVDLGEGTWGRPDVMVRSASTGHPVLVIEAGTSNDYWWNKVDQCLKYAVGLYDDKGRFTHPVLVTVLTVECKQKEKEDTKDDETETHKAAEEGAAQGKGNAEDGGEADRVETYHPCFVDAVLIAEEAKKERKKEKETDQMEGLEEHANLKEVERDEGENEECEDDGVDDDNDGNDDDDDEDYTYEVDHDDDEVEKQVNCDYIFATARVGTFLITSRKERPSKLNDFRLALLRRIETSDVNFLSTELGRVVRAGCLLSLWTSGQASIDHDYLGPNCRRVGNKVNAPKPVGFPMGCSSTE